jgi:hypothetical protein
MNCHYDEALKYYVFTVHFNKAHQVRTNYRINISDDDTRVMRGTASSSDTRQSEEAKFSFRNSTSVWCVTSCVLTQCPVCGVPHQRICYGMSSLMKDFYAKRPSCSQTRQKVKVSIYKRNLIPQPAELIEAAPSSETSVPLHRSTRLHMPQDRPRF